MEVEYNRLRLSRIFNEFNTVTKTPVLQSFAVGGSSVKLSDMLDQMNLAFGTKLLISGTYPDIADITVTAPAKDGYLDITVTATINSLRIAPSTTFKFRMVNRGSKLQDKVVNRKIYPLLTIGGTVNVPGITVGLNERLSALDVRNIDFTSALGRSGSQVLRQDGGYDFYLSTDALSKINAQLAAVNLPPISSTYKFGYVYGYPAVSYMNERWSAEGGMAGGIYKTNATTYANNPYVNKELYAYTFYVPPAAIVGSYNGPNIGYYLQFNRYL